MKVKNIILASIVITSFLQADDKEIKQEGIKYIKMLGSELKSNLVKKMQKDPSGELALGFCIGAASSITEDVNKKLPQNATVRRTALKYRNEANKPDAMDKDVLISYAESIKNKTFTPKDIVVLKTSNTYRVYKPLLTKGACLKCHGTNVDKKLKSTIAKAYPNDKAMDFLEGDFRGAIVAEIKK